MSNHKYGCLKITKDYRDYKFKYAKSTPLPELYKIPQQFITKDQGMVGSCVAHALASFEESIFGGTFSTNFIYGYRPITYYQGEGMDMRDALHTLLHIGDCVYAHCGGNDEVPDIIEKITPKLALYKPFCGGHRIFSYARLYSERGIKECLLRNVPVPITIPVVHDLTLKDGIIQYDKHWTIDGYHAVLVIGYTKEGFIIQNSWGEYWGKRGTAILPYDYPIDSAWALDAYGNIVTKKPCRFFVVLGNVINNIKNMFTKLF